MAESDYIFSLKGKWGKTGMTIILNLAELPVPSECVINQFITFIRRLEVALYRKRDYEGLSSHVWM